MYAVFLGYLMGLWSLLIQIAWALSFYLLARFSKQVYASTSLHEFLGTKFGKSTRRVAALCSIIGITYFAGWEVAVARSSLSSLATLPGNTHLGIWHNLMLAILGMVILAAIIYTSVWGRRVSGRVNLFLNAIKISCLIFISAALFGSVAANHGLTSSLFLPSFKQAIFSLGIVGFVTNIIFNLSWQFVDNSSWQSICSLGKRGRSGAQTIRLAGIGTLLTVNGMGAVLGALLRGNNAIDSTNALSYVVGMTSHLKISALLAMIVILALSAMSLFDAAILSISQALLVDLNIRWTAGKKTSLTHARLATLLVGIVAAWGISLIIRVLGGSIFNFVYIVILAQLSLVGPVLVGLLSSRRIKGMWLAIVLSLLGGAIATIIGTVTNNQSLLQVAGAITAIVSLVTAIVLYWRFPDKSGLPYLM